MQVRQKSDEQRQQILEHALNIFASRGFDGGSVREIAGLCGVNHAMIKYYFGDKEKLWREAVMFLFQRATSEIAEGIDLERASEGVESAIQEVVITMTAYSARHPEHSRLVMQESMAPGPRLEWIAKQAKEHHDGLWQLLHDAGCPFERDDPRIVAAIYLLSGAYQTPFSLALEAEAIYGIDLTGAKFQRVYTELALTLVPSLAAYLTAPSRKENTPQTNVDGLIDGARIATKQHKDKLVLTIELPHQ